MQWKSVITSVSVLCKTYATLFHSIDTFGTHLEFIKILESRKRPLITVSNHSSTIDDPYLFALLLPWSILLNSNKNRYGFGAKEICFKNPIYSWFFRNGGILPIVRGHGIHQQGMQDALKLLDENKWIHIFSEGKVNQTSELLKFKWGIGRLIMESKVPPLVIPFYHTGMEHIMPEGSFIKIPRIYKNVTCRFGSVIDSDQLIASTSHLSLPIQRSEITAYLHRETKQLQI